MRKVLFGCFALLVLPSSVLAQLDPSVAKPPLAKKLPKASSIHGDARLDNYFWLRDKKSKEVLDYLEAENAYTKGVMKPTEDFQKTLYKEMLGRIEQTDLSVPYRLGDHWYYTRTEKGKQYPIHCRKKGNLEGEEEVLLDLNELAKGHRFLSREDPGAPTQAGR
jgi:oligopeptidase B